MNLILEQMLKAYETTTTYDKKNAIKEVMQEIVLCGLSRGGFFKHAAFYGGTALRIFYGLDRFSEDLDFSLIYPDTSFDINKFLPALSKEVVSYGLNVIVEEKEKTFDSNIQSAFLKGNTKEHLILFFNNETEFKSIPKNEVIKIKFEIDINPPKYATFERKYRLKPTPYEVNLYDQPSLFAGKVHAVLGRSWRNRVKGRDLYDYVFYLSNNIPVNCKHLKERLIQSGHINEKDEFTLVDIKKMLNDRFELIDYSQAKDDVEPFIKNREILNIWSSDFFKSITENLHII